MNIKKLLAAALLPAILIVSAACSGGSGEEKTADIAPSEVVKAVLDEVPIDSGVEKGKSEAGSYYSGLDTDTVEDAAFALCGSAARPDELAVIKCKSAEDAEAAKEALQLRLDSQKELYETYTPDEMYKLEGAIIYSKGKYAIFIALSDNDKAKSVVEEKLSA
ncbi:MAG: DUF4358 domain-containing protein [Firmicutes bacterium]|nr:DUF4358 domain-containing protein [[Eubacterium] siraeum]MCM1488949.1 DUF4358 domain-containing protein [Bacillota bacterium]